MKKTVSIKLDPDLYKEAKKQADFENRNFSNFVETVLKERLKMFV